MPQTRGETLTMNPYPFNPYLFTVSNDNAVTCSWPILCNQLLQQWTRLSRSELESTGHDRHRIARLIQAKYGIPISMAENYLRNFERTLPLLGCA
jgi:hypothetical protein